VVRARVALPCQVYMAAAKEMPDPSTGYPFLEKTRSRRVSAPCVQACAVTDRGLVRSHNEDTFHVADDGSILIAADGLGGHAAGEIASEIATQFVAELVTSERDFLRKASADQITNLLVTALYGAHEAVLDEAQSDKSRSGMGTTLIAAVIANGVAYVGHVGDVRGYVFGGDGLIQITDDHSPVGELVRAGTLSPEEARDHPEKHLISQAIGLEPGIAPELSEVDIVPGEQLLLCSDGLWEALTDEEITAILSASDTPYTAAVALTDAANEHGGPDNITAVVYTPRGS
jgi:serine/threonine protein phosphatase PrpC